MNTTRSKNKYKRTFSNHYNTTVSSFEKHYRVKLGVDGTMKLGDYFKIKGYPSLAKMLQD